MKIFLLTLAIIAAYSSRAQTIHCGSIINSELKCQNDVAMNQAGTSITVQKATVQTPKKIVFSNPTIVLNGAAILCDELEFTAAVTTVQCINVVKIECRQLTMGNNRIIFKSAKPATLSLITAMPLQTASNIAFEAQNGLKVNLAQH